MTTRRTRTMGLVAVAVLAAGCGSGSGNGSAGSEPAASSPDVATIRIDTRGGFTSLDSQLAIVPHVSVFGDGAVVVTGPTTAQYPPHALPNLLTGRITAHRVTGLVASARAAGLLGPSLDAGRPGVTDLPTTTVTIATRPDCPPESKCAYRFTTQSAYALDFTGGPTPGLTPRQHQARDRLRTFVRAVDDAATGAATGRYSPTEVAVYVHPAAGGEELSISGGVTDWPLPSNLATIGVRVANSVGYRCAVLTGADARTALAAAANASSMTRWRSDGASYAVTWRPLLTDEHACPAGP